MRRCEDPIDNAIVVRRKSFNIMNVCKRRYLPLRFNVSACTWKHPACWRYSGKCLFWILSGWFGGSRAGV